MAESPSELQAEIEKLERKHAENPEGRYFVPLANDYRKVGDLDRAEELLREGLRKHPDYLSAHIVLGRCLADRDKTGEAADEFTYVLSMDPQNLIALRSLGELALADGRREDAARWYRELLAVDPMNDDARQALAQLEAPVETDEVPALGEGAWWDAGGQGTDDSLETTSVPGSEPDQSTVPELSNDSQEWDRGERFGEFTDLEAREQPSYGSGSGGDRGFDETMFDDDSSHSAIEDDEGSAEVVTETIAELYARQGLHDRAAEVYRELIRRRGGDAVLEQRLAEVESQAGGRMDAADPFADSFAAGFADQPLTPDYGGGADDADAGHPDAAQATRTVTIAEYLAGLANWSPRNYRSEAAPAAYEVPEDREMTAEPRPSEAPTASGAASGAADPFPWELPGDEQPPAGSGTPPASEGRTDASAAGFGSVPGADEPAREAEPSIELEDYFPAEPSEPGARAEPAEPADSAQPAEPAASLPTSPDREVKPAADQVPSGGEADDDLESFQAWLRSLKR